MGIPSAARRSRSAALQMVQMRGFAKKKNKSQFSQSGEEVMQLQMKERRAEITRDLIGQEFRVHDGRLYHKVKVDEEMLGHKFAEFVDTKRRGPDPRPKKSTKKQR